jgi:hypothetical protein
MYLLTKFGGSQAVEKNNGGKPVRVSIENFEQLPYSSFRALSRASAG